MKKMIPRSNYRFWVKWRSADGLEKIEQVPTWPQPRLYRMFFHRLMPVGITESTLPQSPSTSRREYLLYDKTVKKTRWHLNITFEYRELA